MVAPTARTSYVDNIRTFLTALVILHHTALPYGGVGTWFYTSPYHTPGSSIILVSFNTINQTYFMATFFLLSGYFSAAAASKRSRSAFLKDKWRRLGVPTVIYSLFGPGVVRAIVKIVQDGGGLSEAVDAFWQGVKTVRGVRGAVWYCALLLIFDGLYALLRPRDFGLVRRMGENTNLMEESAKVRTASIGQVALALTVVITASFFLRARWPIGEQFEPLALNMGYVPQYVLFYVTGVWAYLHLESGLQYVIDGTTKAMLGMIIALISFINVLLVRREFRKENGSLQEIMELGKGGWNRFALIYAVFNETTGIQLSSAISLLFRKMFAERWIIGGFDLARYSYATFLVHIPVVVFLQCLIDGWDGNGVLKTFFVGIPAVVGSWIAGWMLVRITDGLGYKGYV